MRQQLRIWQHRRVRRHSAIKMLSVAFSGRAAATDAVCGTGRQRGAKGASVVRRGASVVRRGPVWCGGPQRSEEGASVV